ncbi:hypothetical protein [Cryptosporangium phraense]|uniref:Uncharacterized protein n=1 Tax=Cryptosporangium phraense TaxID=2593070 RepID=A0A545AEN3_9ACTN|nr:hypothetical protein [Cryptosporangium phraense]TQS39797.1 hypothetical protein FL583_38155 [Cryptosporangium phraense]
MPEASTGEDSGCQLQYGDSVNIVGSGRIKSGVFLTGWNGPQGWTDISYDSKFPSPSSRVYSLLVSVDGRWRYVGVGTSFTYTGRGSGMILRTNDDVPGNGEGSFRAEVQVVR